MNHKKVLHFSRNRNFLIYSALFIGIVNVLLGFIIQYSKAPESVKIKKTIKGSCPWITPSELSELIESNNLKNIFDDVFSIEEVGIYKPSSKVYDLPIKKYNIQKDEVVFLSANTWDVSGGGNYGYNSIWVNRNKNIFDNLDYKPSNEINNLKQLLDLV